MFIPSQQSNKQQMPASFLLVVDLQRGDSCKILFFAPLCTPPHLCFIQREGKFLIRYETFQKLSFPLQRSSAAQRCPHPFWSPYIEHPLQKLYPSGNFMPFLPSASQDNKQKGSRSVSLGSQAWPSLCSYSSLPVMVWVNQLEVALQPIIVDSRKKRAASLVVPSWLKPHSPIHFHQGNPHLGAWRLGQLTNQVMACFPRDSFSLHINHLEMSATGLRNCFASGYNTNTHKISLLTFNTAFA